MLYRSGLRISEALSINTAQMDFTRRSIRVRGKGDSITTRYWHPSADDALARWVDKRRELGIRGRGPLFCTLQGGPMLPVYARNLVRRLALQAGVEKRVHPHAFRHTFAFELERAGVPVTTISKLLGHRHVSTTSVYLDHLTNSQAGDDLMTANLPELL
jgi:integrase/recombinase XerC